MAGFTREGYIEQILDRLASLRMYIETKNGVGMYDSNKYAENFYAGVLNRIYGWNLGNANEVRENAPGIDLIDVENQIVVQVSTTNTTTKIHKTIEACRKFPVELEGFHLIMLFIIGKKDQYHTEFDAEGFLEFDKEEDIWDNQTIIKALQKRTTSIKVLRDLCEYLNEELSNIFVSPCGDAVVSSQFLKDCTKEYIDKWSKPLFLNNGEKDPGLRTILQKNLYIPPTYLAENSQRREDILAFLQKKGGKLVLGYPGIGKTTLLVYFLNSTDEWRRKRVCRLADFSSRDECRKWKAEKRYAEDRLLEALGVSKNALKDTILLMDGLDEIDFAGDERVEFLNQLQEVFDEIPGFTWIVTCRTNYIDVDSDRLKLRYAVLNEWNQSEIKDYVNQYAALENEHKDYTYLIENAQKNHEVLGIPLILYMVLASGIQVNHDISLVEVYNRIFNLEQGGIYEKIIDNQKWDRYPNATVKEKKELIHRIAQKIAFWMFENNPEGAAIPQRDYQKILNDCGDSRGTFGIGSYFQMVRHTEGTNEMCFVHRSMYEYFAIDYLIWDLRNALVMETERRKAALCRTLANFGKKGKIWDGYADEPLIYQFLKVKIQELFRDYTSECIESVYLLFEESVFELFSKGILKFAYADKDLSECSNVLQEELNCGLFLTHILRIVYILYNPDQEFERHVRLFQTGMKSLEENDCFCLYLRSIANNRNRVLWDLADLHGIDLSNVNLSAANLRGSDLNIASLAGTNLAGADLSNTDLRGANLNDADLHFAFLQGADLRYASLQNADLRDVDLSAADLNLARFTSRFGDESTFPVSSLNDAVFDIIYVDEVLFIRKAFFDKFQNS